MELSIDFGDFLILFKKPCPVCISCLFSSEWLVVACLKAASPGILWTVAPLSLRIVSVRHCLCSRLFLKWGWAGSAVCAQLPGEVTHGSSVQCTTQDGRTAPSADGA